MAQFTTQIHFNPFVKIFLFILGLQCIFSSSKFKVRQKISIYQSLCFTWSQRLFQRIGSPKSLWLCRSFGLLFILSQPYDPRAGETEKSLNQVHLVRVWVRAFVSNLCCGLRGGALCSKNGLGNRSARLRLSTKNHLVRKTKL